MANNFYKAKTWNAICDSCGFKFKSSDLKKRWDGLMVDDACWEPRQPQDFLRAVQENSNHLPWTRPDTTSLTFVPIASFTATPTMGQYPLLVTFTDTSFGTPTSWSWDFGDGNTSVLQNPTNTYTLPGIYNVSLTATNSAGSNTVTQYMYVVAQTAAPVNLEGWSATNLHFSFALSNSNKTMIGNPGAQGSGFGTVGKSVGDNSNTYQFEVLNSSTLGAFPYLGIATPTLLNTICPGNAINTWGWSGAGGHIRNNNAIVAFGGSFGPNDVVGITLSLGTGTLRWYKNGILNFTAPATLAGTWYPHGGSNASPVTLNYTINMGTSAFTYPIVGAQAWDT